MHLENFTGKKIQIKFKNFPNDLVGSITAFSSLMSGTLLN